MREKSKLKFTPRTRSGSVAPVVTSSTRYSTQSVPPDCTA
jgi:hypothetical protein